MVERLFHENGMQNLLSPTVSAKSLQCHTALTKEFLAMPLALYV